MAHKTIAILMCLVGLIHILPAVGIFGSERLASLYGIHDLNADMLLLMQHRAVLLGLIGVVLFATSWVAPNQLLGISIGLLSTISFCALFWLSPTENPLIHRIYVIDIAAVLLLLLALLMKFYQMSQNRH